MGTLDWLSDNLVELRGPVNIADDAALNISATVTAKLYDTAFDCRVGKYTANVTEDAEVGATIIMVDGDETLFFPGSLIILEFDGGVLWADSVVSTFQGGVDLLAGIPSGQSTSVGKRMWITQWDDTADRIALDDFSQWEDGMNAEIRLNDGTVIERVVSSIDRNSGFMTLATPLGVPADVSNIVKRKIGPSVISMSDFGTFPTSDPVVGDPEWGFRGTIDHDAPDLALGMRVRGEITAVDGALNLRRKAVSTVINK